MVECKSAQATSHTMTAKIVFPERGPTSLLSSSHPLIVSLTSASVVTTPRASAPIPPAMIAAEIGQHLVDLQGARAARATREG